MSEALVIRLLESKPKPSKEPISERVTSHPLLSSNSLCDPRRIVTHHTDDLPNIRSGSLRFPIGLGLDNLLAVPILLLGCFGGDHAGEIFANESFGVDGPA